MDDVSIRIQTHTGREDLLKHDRSSFSITTLINPRKFLPSQG
jgi:hypothetical protein